MNKRAKAKRKVCEEEIMTSLLYFIYRGKNSWSFYAFLTSVPHTHVQASSFILLASSLQLLNGFHQLYGINSKGIIIHWVGILQMFIVITFTTIITPSPLQPSLPLSLETCYPFRIINHCLHNAFCAFHFTCLNSARIDTFLHNISYRNLLKVDIIMLKILLFTTKVCC